MTNEQRVKKIEERLNKALKPEQLEITDNSRLHEGHEGTKSGKGHFSVTIKSDQFKDMSLVDSHRAVYHALGDLMETDIHAINIRVLF